MRKTILLFAIGMLGLTANAQIKEEKAITKTINQFAEAADNNDVKSLENYLDDNFRIVMNRLFGSEAVGIVSKTDYLAKIESKEWGGDNREVEIKGILINGNNASVNVVLAGEKSTFNSIMILLKDGEGNWKIVSDTPTIL